MECERCEDKGWGVRGVECEVWSAKGVRCEGNMVTSEEVCTPTTPDQTLAVYSLNQPVQ